MKTLAYARMAAIALALSIATGVVLDTAAPSPTGGNTTEGGAPDQTIFIPMPTCGKPPSETKCPGGSAD
jgi:hypothetical protein